MGLLRTSGCALLALAASGLAAEPHAMTLDEVARGYVELTLAVGEHDPNYVDAYYGPEEMRAKVKAAGANLATLADRADELVAAAEAVPPPSGGNDADVLAL